MDKMPILSILLQSIPEAMIINFLTLTLYGLHKKITVKKLAVLGVVSGILSYFVRMLPYPFGFHALIQLFILIILLSIIFRLGLRKSLLVSITGLVILAVAETIFGVIVSLITGISFQEMLADQWLRIIIPWFHLSILLLTSLIIYKKGFLLGFLDNIESKKTKGFIPLVILIALSIAYIFAFLAIYTLVTSVGQTLTVSFNVRLIVTFVLVIGIILFLILMVKKLLFLAEMEVTIDSQQSLINNLNNLFVSIKTQRHDFIHHIQVIYSLLETNQQEECKEYLNNLLGEVKEINEVVTVNNPAVGALLRAKKAVAAAKNIDFALHIDCKLDNTRVPPLHLVTILANLIDNSFEAVEDLEPDYRRCSLTIKQFSSIYVFEVNNYRPLIAEEDLPKIFGEGFSNKGNLHSGLGLATAKKLTEKYKGEIGVTSNEEKGITFTVALPF